MVPISKEPFTQATIRFFDLSNDFDNLLFEIWSLEFAQRREEPTKRNRKSLT